MQNQNDRKVLNWAPSETNLPAIKRARKITAKTFIQMMDHPLKLNCLQVLQSFNKLQHHKNNTPFSVNSVLPLAFMVVELKNNIDSTKHLPNTSLNLTEKRHYIQEDEDDTRLEQSLLMSGCTCSTMCLDGAGTMHRCQMQTAAYNE